MTDYQKALWIPNNNFFPDSGPKRMIVIHGTAGGSSATGIAVYFENTEGTDNPVSSHYIVDQAGNVVQTVLEKDGAWGNGIVNNPAFEGENPNDYTVSIEHVKADNMNSFALTDAQKSASFALIKDISTRHGIPYAEIIPHSLIDPVNRAHCPGAFPWEELKAFLEGPMPKTTQPSQFQLQAALAEWNSIRTTPTGTGIYEQWLADYCQGIFRGPPLDHEYDTVDWEGKPIIKQQFLYCHVEWSNGLLGWYGPGGKV
jgi:N-acetyl-anhydromuramyl-L-alanine amidase AmpD